MSSIGGLSSSMMNSIMNQNIGSRPDPVQKFKEKDADGNGGLDKTELSAMGKELSKLTGQTVDLASSMESFDANGDGLLGQEEMGSMMKEKIGSSFGNMSDFKTQQAMQSYQANSGKDQFSTLLELLDQEDTSSSTNNRSNSEKTT
jgi:Ca2+-binding EF-hand superfamily protein